MFTVLPGGWWRTSGAGAAGPAVPPAPAGPPCINMDPSLCEAEVRCEAGLGGADVAVHSCQIEKQPAT